MFNRRGRGRPKLDHGKKKGGGVGKLKLTAQQQKQKKRVESPRRRSGRNHDTSPPRPRSKSPNKPTKSPNKPQARQSSSSPSKKSSKEKVTSPLPQAPPAKGRPFKFKFSVTEQVLCYEPDPTKAKVLYDSKVLDMAVNKDGKGKKFVEYLVHFQGWNSSWDRYVREDLILKDSDENRQLQMELKEKANVLKESLKKGRKSTDLLKNAVGQQNKDKVDKSGDTKEADCEVEEDDDQDSKAEILQRMVIPEEAKLILDYDYLCIVRDRKLSILPAKKCVINILEDYIKESGLQMLRSWTEKRKQAIKDMVTLSKNKVSSSIPTTSTSPQTITLPVYKKKTPIEISDEEFNKMILRLKFKIEFVDNIRIMFDFLAGHNLMYVEENRQFKKSKRICCNPQHVYNQSFDKPEPEVVIKEEPVQSKDKRKKPNDKPEAPKGRGRKRSVKFIEPVKENERTNSPSPKRQTRSSVSFEPEQLPPSTNISSPKRRGPKPKLSILKGDRIKKENSPKPSTSTKSTEPVFYTEIKSRNKTAPKIVYEVLTDRVKKLIDFIPLWSLLPKKMYYTLPCKPSLLYGVPHLLRLIVRIPSILEKMSLSCIRTQTLVKHLNLLLRFIVVKITVDPTNYSFDGRKIRGRRSSRYEESESEEESDEEVEEEEEEVDDEDDEEDVVEEDVVEEDIEVEDVEEEEEEGDEEDDEEATSEDEEEEESSEEEPEPIVVPKIENEPRRLRSRIKIEPVSD